MNCCICGTVKNCAPYLPKVLKNMEMIGNIFDNYKIIIYYDKSYDNSLTILKNIQKTNNKIQIYVNKNQISPFRTHNLAIARNFCLNYVKKNKELYSFFIMMDCDDVNCKNINTDVLKKHLQLNSWDALSFNTYPNYYDIWALSIYPFCFSYNHFRDNTKYYTIIQKYMTSLLRDAKKKNQLVECISAFNGFSIYKTSKFMNTFYDGRVRLDIVPLRNINTHKNATNSNLIFKKYVTVDGKYEDCEHRVMHMLARQRNGAKIMVSPEILFS